jgi:oxygen-independent coproporphyrinogen-3 oxidase
MPDFGPFRPPGYPPRSAYLHLPFCHRRCFYCDFPVVPLGDLARGEAPAPGASSIAAYLGLLHQEIETAPLGPPLSTVYFGGGTPSLLTPAQIRDLVRALRSRFGLAPGAEVTLELDPASFDQQRLSGYLAGGINRVSLGGQSFDDQVLFALGRRHRGADVVEAANWLSEACLDGRLTSWSLDLIQGVPQLPGGGLGAWGQQLQQAIALQPPHLSVYDLSIEPGTVFERRQQQGDLALPDQDLGADLMELTWRALAAAGYGHYEISNFAKPGHASRHNRVYWSGAGWWGFGMGATGAPWGERVARPRTREGYAAWLAQELGDSGGDRRGSNHPGVLPSQGLPLDERLMVGLRRREGVVMELLLAQQGWGPQEVAWQVVQLRQRLAAPLEAGWLVIEGSRWRLSDPGGLAVSNGVLRELLAWWQEQLDGSGRQSSYAGLPHPEPALGLGEG